jgi:hypothetical protein
MSALVVEKFAQYGGLLGLIVGVMFVALSIAIVSLWKVNNKKDRKIEELQEKRMAESKEMGDSLYDLSLQSQEIMTTMTNAMRSLKEAVLLRR